MSFPVKLDIYVQECQFSMNLQENMHHTSRHIWWIDGLRRVLITCKIQLQLKSRNNEQFSMSITLFMIQRAILGEITRENIIYPPPQIHGMSLLGHP